MLFHAKTIYPKSRAKFGMGIKLTMPRSLREGLFRQRPVTGLYLIDQEQMLHFNWPRNQLRAGPNERNDLNSGNGRLDSRVGKNVKKHRSRPFATYEAPTWAVENTNFNTQSCRRLLGASGGAKKPKSNLQVSQVAHTRTPTQKYSLAIGNGVCSGILPTYTILPYSLPLRTQRTPLEPLGTLTITHDFRQI